MPLDGEHPIIRVTQPDLVLRGLGAILNESRDLPIAIKAFDRRNQGSGVSKCLKSGWLNGGGRKLVHTRDDGGHGRGRLAEALGNEKHTQPDNPRFAHESTLF